MSIYKKEAFIIPEELIYLDGNSLGPLSKASQARIQAVVNQQWGKDLISSWNKHDWFNLPEIVGDKVADILHAPKGSVTICDSTSINLYKCLHAAIQIRSNHNGGSKTILTDNLNFPTDLYIAQGILSSIDADYDLIVLDTKIASDPTQTIVDAIDKTTDIVMLTHVGYDTGYAYDLHAISTRAREMDCLTVWDFSHSIGALHLDLEGVDIDFAVGCTYKYLNGGPGAPAFLYINPRHQDILPVISGWMGQKEPFKFEQNYIADSSIRKFRVGTPHILSLAPLDAAISIFEDVDMRETENTAQVLIDQFIHGIETHCPQMDIISPRDRTKRGSQLVIEPRDSDVSAYAIIQNLIARNVVGDFRQPNRCRFGIAPLYISASDIQDTVSILSDILHTQSWKQEVYFKRSIVT